MFEIKTKWSYSFYILFILTLCNLHANAQFKITDTVYYNDRWEICEKPVAKYYRAGILAGINTSWFFSGEVEDHLLENDQLLMKGVYSDDGFKEGDFKFYYSNGQVQAFGKYKGGVMFGDWNWYYPDGKEKATINFIGNRFLEFLFVKFTDREGKITLENGSGDFSWCTNPFDTLYAPYQLSGSFSSGKRVGKWHYVRSPGMPRKLKNFTEKYNRQGQLEYSANDDLTHRSRNMIVFFDFSPMELMIPEKMDYDGLFNINGDSLALTNLAYYLIERKPTEVNLRYKIFKVAFETILKTLEQYKYKLHFNQTRDIDCKIEFMIGTKSTLEKISFTGSGLEIDEMNFFTFLLGKFKYVEMPGDQSVAIETHYTIYCFSLDFQEVIPDNVDTKYTKELIFSFEPREKMIKYLHDNKDVLKKFFKEKMDDDKDH